MQKNRLLMLAGVAAVALATWLGIRRSQDAGRQAIEEQGSGWSESSEAESSGDGAQPGLRKVPQARPVLAPAPKFLGDKVAVLEGALNARGSDGPVKLRKLDGAVLEAARMELQQDGSMKLLPPTKIIGAGGVVMTSDTGTLKLRQDGSFVTEGPFSLASARRVAGQDGE